MNDVFRTQTVSKPIRGHMTPPGSKSITNRAILCAALAQGRSVLTGVLDSEDTRLMMEALHQLGFPLTYDAERKTAEITGYGGRIPIKKGDIYVGNSGTTARFLTAVLAGTQGGEYRIHGKPRMHQRPIGDLLHALQNLGADVRSQHSDDCPPVVIGPDGNFYGKTTVSGAISSQFLSALLMAAPLSRDEILLEMEDELVSKPYIQMTLAVMQSFGVEVAFPADWSHFTISRKSNYRKIDYAVEPDASAASYFFAAAAVTGGSVEVEGLCENALQGDIDFCRCLEQMGSKLEFGPNSTKITGAPLHGVDVDMNAISDTVMTLAVVALFADSPTRITNVAHIRHKETDRIAALVCELRKLGADVEERDDGLIITPVTDLHGAEIATYDDHRMAMSFAVAGLKIPGIMIQNPGCTAKTYPGFFVDWQKYIDCGCDKK